MGIDDLGERLREVHRRMEAIKHSQEGAVSYAILGMIGMTPLPVEQRLIGVFTPKVTAVMTNVPGPRQPVFFAGTPVAGVLGWVPAGGNIGMGLSIFSYDGGITVGLQVATALVSDPETIMGFFAEELTALRRLARTRRRPARGRARRPAATW